MCGFVAELRVSGEALGLRALEAATDLLAHRGPDDRTFFVEAPYSVGFRRLSIFDLSNAARQPMISRDGRYVLAFNGAIYNWPELRRELESRGHAFETHGDAEVLLAAWREWGAGCLDRLNGMFAFLVWDRAERRLSGARDRFGVKPLFWSNDGKAIRFASEIKALRALAPSSHGIDWDSLADFAVNDQLDSREETLFSGIRRVPAGMCFNLDAGGRITWTRWWSLSDAVAARSPSASPAEEFADTFEDAVGLRMRADVGVGVLLSGGLDSSSIICAMARMRGDARDGLRAFYFASPDIAGDESTAMAATLGQTGALLEQVNPAPLELWHSLDKHLWYHDEPVYSMSSLVSERLIAAARRSGVKVLLNGQGADEVLGGYPSYFGVHWSQLLRAGKFSTAVSSMRRLARGDPARAGLYVRAAIRDAAIRSMRAFPGAAWLARRRTREPAPSDWVAPELVSRAEQFRSPGSSTLDSALRVSLERADLPLYLRQEDRNAMAHGVEARLPFLDHRLVTLAFGLGPEWKLAAPNGKVLLREAMRGRIPEVVRTQVRKLGFPTPIDDWFRGPFYEPMQDLILSREFRECGIWQPARVADALEAHRAGRAAFGARLFDVAQTSAWLRAVVAVPSVACSQAIRQ